MVIDLHCHFAWVWSHLGDSLLLVSVRKFPEWLSTTVRVSWIHFYCSGFLIFIKFYQDIYLIFLPVDPTPTRPTDLSCSPSCISLHLPSTPPPVYPGDRCYFSFSGKDVYEKLLRGESFSLSFGGSQGREREARRHKSRAEGE